MFRCGFCYTSQYSTEAELFAHQSRRGHWRDVFDRKIRREGKLAGRIPDEILNLISNSDEENNESDESSQSVCLFFFHINLFKK